MTAQELRDLYINFFKEKHNHSEIPGASLIKRRIESVRLNILVSLSFILIIMFLDFYFVHIFRGWC